MKKIGKKSAIILIALLFIILGTVTIRQNIFSPDAKKTASKAVIYYCPMHPTYTSNKSGDCPICNMKLVKRESAEVSADKGNPQKAEDICYMRNCPMMKPGQTCPMMVVAKAGEAVTCP